MNEFSNTHDLTLIPLFAALTAALSLLVVPLPFSPVPVSGQTLGVMLSGAVLGARKGAMSQLLYLGLGAVGLPVFAGGTSGPGTLFGPTGGYLWGFAAGAYAVGKMLEGEGKNGSTAKLLLSLVTGGVLLIHLTGLFQLVLVTGIPPLQALSTGVLPFLPGEGLKVATAVTVIRRLRAAGLDKFTENGI